MRQFLALLAAAGAVRWDACWQKIVPKVAATWTEAGVFRGIAPEAVGAVTLDTLDAHVRKGGFLSARRGFPRADDGWETEPFQIRRGTREALEDRGTLILNGVAETVPACARCALAALDVFKAPASLNCYATGPHVDVAAPPHSDAQGIVVLQTVGAQRWRVWDARPFHAAELNAVLTAGKGAPLTLGAPVLDVLLEVGDALYAPAGWPHATATLEDTSVHLTLGLDHAIFGLDRFSMNRAVAARGGERLEVSNAVARPFAGGGDIGDSDVAEAFAAHSARIVEAQARLYGDCLTNTAPGAWKERWLRWADDSCRFVQAHRAFIAGDALVLEDIDEEVSRQNARFAARELRMQGYDM